MMVGDPLTTNTLEQQEQRAQCLRFCMTMFLLFSTFFLIRVQQDTYTHNHDRRRRKHNDPLLAPEAASVDVVYIHRSVFRGLWVRGASGVGPILTSAFIAYLPDESLPVSFVDDQAAAPKTSSSTSSGSSSSSSPFAAFEPLAELRQAAPPRGSWVLQSDSPWGPHMAVSAVAEVGAPGLPSLLAIYRDTRLYRHGLFPGCEAAAAAASSSPHCLFSFIKLPLSACLTAQSAAAAAAAPPAPPSWTCANLLSGSTTGDPVDLSAADERAAASEEEAGCIRLVTGASLGALTSYAAEALRRPALRNTSQAGALLQFCGAPLPQLITVDSISGRVFFAQRIKPGPPLTRRLSQENEGEGGPLGGPQATSGRSGTLAEPKRQQAAAAAATAAAGSSSSNKHAAEAEGGEGLEQTHAAAGFAAARRLGAPPLPQRGLASLCVAYAYLDGFYDDVSRCVPIETEKEGPEALGDPVFLQSDPLTDALIFAAFDREGQLALSVHHALSLKRRFAVKFEGFKSGRLMSAEFSSLGKILVTGDEEPYRHHLDIIDVATGYHERMDLSPA
ncbi:hypothetical protein Esti_003709 [Eimeria stiedai]